METVRHPPLQMAPGHYRLLVHRRDLQHLATVDSFPAHPEERLLQVGRLGRSDLNSGVADLTTLLRHRPTGTVQLPMSLHLTEHGLVHRALPIHPPTRVLHPSVSEVPQLMTSRPPRLL